MYVLHLIVLSFLFEILKDTKTFSGEKAWNKELFKQVFENMNQSTEPLTTSQLLDIWKPPITRLKVQMAKVVWPNQSIKADDLTS